MNGSPRMRRIKISVEIKIYLNNISVCDQYYIRVVIVATVHSVILLYVLTAGLQGRSQVSLSSTTTNQCGQDEKGVDRGTKQSRELEIAASTRVPLCRSTNTIRPKGGFDF